MCPEIKTTFSLADEENWGRSAEFNAQHEGPITEIAGVIKWFDVAKGYGFIVPDNGMSDVFLHVSCLRQGGFQTAFEGARVVCEIIQGPKGLTAFRVISMDNSTAVHPSQLPQRTHVTVEPTSGLERAQVKWFNRLRGFGFLTRGDSTPDIFVHMETLRRFGMTELRPGQFVRVRFGPGPKGLMVAQIEPEGNTPLSEGFGANLPLVNHGDGTLAPDPDGNNVIGYLSSSRLSSLFHGDLGLSKPSKDPAVSGGDEEPPASIDVAYGLSDADQSGQIISATKMLDLFLGRGGSKNSPISESDRISAQMNGSYH